MMTRTISVIAGTSLTLPAVAPNILAIEGYCNGVAGTQYFLQLHNAVPTSGVTAPLRSWQILGKDGFTFNDRDIGLLTANLTQPNAQGTFYLYLSSTDVVFTTSGITCDINCEVEEFELEQLGTTTVPSYVSVSSLQVLTDLPNQTRALYALTVTETQGTASYIQLYAQALPPFVPNTPPVIQIPLAANATVILNFGDNGIHLFQQNLDGSLHYGIWVGISKTSSYFDGNGLAVITAVYK